MKQRFNAEDAEGPQRTLAMNENEIGHAIIGAAMKVHSAVGPGLLESAYEACLVHELGKQGLLVRKQVLVPIRYDGVAIDNGYRIDLLVQHLVVVELKAIAEILPVHRGQLLSYLRFGGFKLGYLFNFNVEHMRHGIVRIVNGL